MELLPIVTVFDPEPTAPYPTTTSLDTPSAEALVPDPMKTEVPEVSLAVDPSAMYIPDWYPWAVLSFPVVFE